MCIHNLCLQQNCVSAKFYHSNTHTLEKTRGGPPMDLHMSKTSESFNSKLSYFTAFKNRSILHRHINVMRQDNLRGLFAYAKTKMQISFAVTAKLISVFVFATRIVQSLYFLNPKFQASSHLLWLYSLVCV